MAITPHGWHIPGSPMPEGYDNAELKISRQCGGFLSCETCQAADRQWQTISKEANAPVNATRAAEGLPKARRSDAVVHPSHYNMYDGIEIVDLAEQMNFNKGNAVKYITRAEFKGKEIEDLEKARYYLKKEIKRIKRAEKKAAKAKAQEEAQQAMANYAVSDLEKTLTLYDVNSLYPAEAGKVESLREGFKADAGDIFALRWDPGTPRLREFAEWVMKADADNFVEAKGDILHVNIPSQGVHTIVLRPFDWLIFSDGRFQPKTNQQYIAMISGGLTGEESKVIRKGIHPAAVRQWHASEEAFNSISEWVTSHNPTAYVEQAGDALILTTVIMNHNTNRFGIAEGHWIVKDGHGFSVYTNDEFKKCFEVI